MSKVSFEDIGAVIATFAAQDGVKPGQMVKITANGEVGACSANDAFAGQAQSVRGGFAGVQVKGFLTLPITGSVALGRVSLAADGTGGVQTASTGGVPALVVSVDAAAKTAVVCLSEKGGFCYGESV